MNKADQLRLAQIRMDNAKWSAMKDTSSWDGTFLLRLIDESLAEIKALRRANHASHLMNKPQFPPPQLD